MAIRYDKKLNNEITRIVRNYNAKITRLNKSNKDVYIPSKFDNEALQSLKQTVRTRDDLKRGLKALQNFTEKGGENYVKIKGAKIPKFQYQNIKMYQSLAKRRIGAKKKFYEETKPTSTGKMESITFAQIGEQDYLNTIAKYNQLIDVDIFNKSDKERDLFIKKLQSNTKTLDVRNWQENYADIFLDTAYIYGVPHSKVSSMRKRLLELSPTQFQKLFSTERTIQNIIYYYKLAMDIGYDLAIENVEDDAVSMFNNLYNNLDEILIDYE